MMKKKFSQADMDALRMENGRLQERIKRLSEEIERAKARGDDMKKMAESAIDSKIKLREEIEETKSKIAQAEAGATENCNCKEAAFKAIWAAICNRATTIDETDENACAYIASLADTAIRLRLLDKAMGFIDKERKERRD